MVASIVVNFLRHFTTSLGKTFTVFSTKFNVVTLLMNIGRLKNHIRLVHNKRQMCQKYFETSLYRFNPIWYLTILYSLSIFWKVQRLFVQTSWIVRIDVHRRSAGNYERSHRVYLYFNLNISSRPICVFRNEHKRLSTEIVTILSRPY